MTFIIHGHNGTSTEVPLSEVRILEYPDAFIIQYVSKIKSVADWDERIEKKDISRIEIKF